MTFMVPQYSEEPFYTHYLENGDEVLVPDQVEDKDVVRIRRAPEGVYCRLSAPGYMDCTPWDGPFDDIEQAKAHIRDTYEVDPETGDDLPCDYWSEPRSEDAEPCGACPACNGGGV